MTLAYDPKPGGSYLVASTAPTVEERGGTPDFAESVHWRPHLALGLAANNVLSPGEARGSILKAWGPFWAYFRPFLGFWAWPLI